MPRQGSCRGACCHPRQGACRGPCGLPRLGSPKGCLLLSAYLILNVFTKICMPPWGCLLNPCPLGAVDSRVICSIGAGRVAAARVLPGLLELSPGKDLAGGSPLRPLCSLWSWSWRRSASPELRPYLGSPPLPCSVWWCPWLRLPVHSYRGTKSVPLFLYTDRSPRAWATHKCNALLG